MIYAVKPAIHDGRYGAADLISGGRLQLGISGGSPEQVIEGWRYFGYEPAESETDADIDRKKKFCTGKRI